MNRPFHILLTLALVCACAYRFVMYDCPRFDPAALQGEELRQLDRAVTGLGRLAATVEVRLDTAALARLAEFARRGQPQSSGALWTLGQLGAAARSVVDELCALLTDPSAALLDRGLAAVALGRIAGDDPRVRVAFDLAPAGASPLLGLFVDYAASRR